MRGSRGGGEGVGGEDGVSGGGGGDGGGVEGGGDGGGGEGGGGEGALNASVAIPTSEMEAKLTFVASSSAVALESKATVRPPASVLSSGTITLTLRIVVVSWRRGGTPKKPPPSSPPPLASLTPLLCATNVNVTYPISSPRAEASFFWKRVALKSVKESRVSLAVTTAL